MMAIPITNKEEGMIAVHPQAAQQSLKLVNIINPVIWIIVEICIIVNCIHYRRKSSALPLIPTFRNKYAQAYDDRIGKL